MKYILIFFLLINFCFAQNADSAKYQLSDFFKYNPTVEAKVQEFFEAMNDTQRVAQMIIPSVGKHGKPTKHVEELVAKQMCGGILLLNGTKEGFKKMVTRFDSISIANGGLKMIYSADAEPSLIKYKIKGSTKVPTALSHTSSNQVKETANIISKDLQYIGIQQNFAPVLDVSAQNKAIGNRSFGDNKDTVIAWSNMFIKESQTQNIITTAKHFPGHGQVKGDTHEKLVFIDGNLNEVENYQPIIDGGVVSIMVAHIAVKNNEKYNTNGLPSTLSREIVTDLLKTEMKFTGLVVTDAMNMGGVASVDKCGLKAVQAGCDMLLMPVNEVQDVYDITNEMQLNEVFRDEVYLSVKKVIRLKILLGLI